MAASRGEGSGPLPVLWQLRFSHSNEKARWALDSKGMPHVRPLRAPGAARAEGKRLYGGETSPALVVEGQLIPDSARIVEARERLRPAPPLYPEDAAARERALALERRFDEELGEHVRRALLYDLLPDSRLSVEALATSHRHAERLAYRALFPALRAGIRRGLGITAANAEAGRASILSVLDRIEADLQPSGYLVGDRFSVADLTAAARLFPFVRPPEFPYPAGALSERRRGTPGFDQGPNRLPLGGEMYRRHRGSSAAVNE